MKTLIRYERNKILINRFAVFSLVLVFAFSLLLSITSMNQFYAFDGVSKEGSGLKAIQIEKELDQKYGGEFTDETMQNMLNDYAVLRQSNGVNPKYIYLNSFQSSVFARFVDVDGNWNGLHVQDVYGKDALQIGFVQGWLKTSSTLSVVLLFYGIVLIFLLSPVFAGEYGGMYCLLLSSKYGRTKCPKAKVLASLQVGIFFLFLLCLLHLGFAYIVYGKQGLDCSILFSSIDFVEDYALPLTCGQLLLFQILIALFSVMAIVGITLWLSSIFQTPLFACLITLVLFGIPMMIPTGSNGMLETLCLYTPIHGLQFQTLFNRQEYMAFGIVPVCVILLCVGGRYAEYKFSSREIVQ